CLVALVASMPWLRGRAAQSDIPGATGPERAVGITPTKTNRNRTAAGVERLIGLRKAMGLTHFWLSANQILLVWSEPARGRTRASCVDVATGTERLLDRLS